jgi:hypothetical protein
MNLATILAVVLLASAYAPRVSASNFSPHFSLHSALQQTAAGQSSAPDQVPSAAQGSTEQPQNSGAPPQTAPKPRRHKKTNTTNCLASNSAAGTSAATTGTSSSATQKPCPPRKVIVRNGGTSEPTVELKGKTSAEQASNQRSTEQLMALTEENLGKIAGLPPDPSRRELVSEIRQFMEQSKSAIAAGDPDRGHNLAIKAHLLSEELVKP